MLDLKDLLFPKRCLGCKKTGNYLCQTCIKYVSFKAQICAVCGKPSIDGKTHFKCLKPLGLDDLIILFSYEKVLRRAIIALKYRYAKDIAEELASISAERAGNIVTLGDSSILMPIPAHQIRKNIRGFNQTEEIGKLLSLKMGWGYESRYLMRKSLRKPQTKLSGDERKRNIKGVFEIFEGVERFNPKEVILFDDVYTTGSTMKEAAKTLKRNGVEKVVGLAIAK